MCQRVDWDYQVLTTIHFSSLLFYTMETTNYKEREKKKTYYPAVFHFNSNLSSQREKKYKSYIIYA